MFQATDQQREVQSPLNDCPAPPRATHPTPDVGVPTQMLDEIDYGMVLLDETAKVRFINRAARIDLVDAHPLQILEMRLHARRHQDVGSLNEALAKAALRRMRGLVSLGEGDARVTVAVIPFGAQWSLVVMGKRQLTQQISAAFFASLHGLTGAEARVLGSLCEGRSPKQIAALNAVCLTTVRTQIVTIRAKTGADNICALIRQVAVLPPMMGALRC